ncbi:pilus assembly protein TadG-related protein [Photobacterium sp. J15]|uniref:pilus assembly protein TadG-related protein n=1 Tax=Photobacterium sp. J15 TaxID=265901 RepID=UPI0007E4A1CB|nr:pilus assembly protein TadG-related protein [Photobacterium sp. J15]
MAIQHKMSSSLKTQKGVVIVFATLAMAVIIGAGALALDIGNLTLSKGKLQNLADSAALSAAKAIDLGGDQTEATAAGKQTITDNLQLDGFNAITVGDSNITIEFSETLPFDTSTATATSQYVRVRIENVDIPDFLVSVFNVDLNTRASAVAGPSTSVERACNITPLSICEGDSSNTVSGYSANSLHVLKASSSTDSSVGSGNFQPVALTDSEGNQMSGANTYKDALAGSFDACLNVVEDEPISTEPGNMVGPSLGVDTRFGIYKGDMKKDSHLYPADIDSNYASDYVQVATEVQVDADGNTVMDADGNPVNKYVPNKSYSAMHNYSKYIYNYADIDYESCLASSSCQSEGYYRRVITVPILKCDQATKSGGRMDVPLKGLACFYLVQPMSVTEHEDDNGGGGNGSWLIGEFISECRINAGNPGMEPDENGPYKIVLFKDPDSEDS